MLAIYHHVERERESVHIFSESKSLQFDLEWVFLALDTGLGHESIWVVLGLPLHLATNCTQFLQENLLGMLGSLRLHVAHHFATLS